VVELEEPLQRVGVLLTPLHLVDEGELATEQDLVAARDVDEHLGDARAQRGLLAGHPYGHLVDLDERRGEPSDLVVGRHRDVDHLEVGAFARRLHALDHPGQRHSDLARGRGQPAKWHDEAAAQHGREEEREEHGEGRRGRHTERRAALARRHVLRGGAQIVDDAVLDPDQGVQAGARGGEPRGPVAVAASARERVQASSLGRHAGDLGGREHGGEPSALRRGRQGEERLEPLLLCPGEQRDALVCRPSTEAFANAVAVRSRSYAIASMTCDSASYASNRRPSAGRRQRSRRA
jgi:hypothetical protein